MGRQTAFDVTITHKNSIAITFRYHPQGMSRHRAHSAGPCNLRWTVAASPREPISDAHPRGVRESPTTSRHPIGGCSRDAAVHPGPHGDRENRRPDRAGVARGPIQGAAQGQVARLARAAALRAASQAATRYQAPHGVASARARPIPAIHGLRAPGRPRGQRRTVEARSANGGGRLTGGPPRRTTAGCAALKLAGTSPASLRGFSPVLRPAPSVEAWT